MKKLVLAGLSGLALLTVAACSDSTDGTTTQSTTPMEDPAAPPATNVTPPADDAAPADEAAPADPAAPATTPAPAE